MEPISAPLASRPEASSPPHSKRDVSPFSSSGASLKPNQVSETSLYGVPIVSLVIDGQERLCLAQISNTLLKSYSYNEIHNRRVALGITCVQCTPVQLEILRRAGAMPISSRRCGMITKREAERLCKSFLGAHTPPKLPENFAFDVLHECAWGCRGNFIPARYNSSRAKCIKCAYCSMYFSPNKFIFHSHRTPESKYTQPDAANFNSWRRHLKLADKQMPDDISHAWEDVKAMFNGGSRKRTMPGSGCDMSPLKTQGSGHVRRAASPEIPHKSLRLDALRFSHAVVLEDDWESQKSRPDQISVSKEAETESASRTDGRFHLTEKNIEHMAKEELQKQLVEQMELRKKMEREFQHLKDNFQDQMKRELSYREEMVQQLQIVRDTLCNELDQERKARYAIQQKLKEAHDALHHFSCKMLTPRHCTGMCTFKPPLLPP
ncbi:SKI family transcriptional corepressor 1 homolog-B [Bagarius yarrelli]|uniref:SKI family transcriptional corepressor 1 homolog-B n=1 Tax=Bagarius yarrelli TaxID=175774 RepID=A0A556TLB9_BAGYA|nr:SKI family transcriptional corepressor 1 homolog-B [Bagarius yarrelli]